jgi:hypothetical protein
MNGGKIENTDAGKSDVGNGNVSGEDEDMLEIPAFNLEDDSSDYGDFRQCQVSPVPTTKGQTTIISLLQYMRYYTYYNI